MLYLVGFFLFFILILILITLVIFKKSKSKSCEIKVPASKTKELTLEELLLIVKTQTKSIEKIEEALSLMTKNFPFPLDENEAKQHFKFVYLFAKNPLCSAKLIVKMQKDLSLSNPKYAKQIEDFQIRGIDAR